MTTTGNTPRRPSRGVLVVSDLDGTIVFRNPASGTPPGPAEDLVPVETHHGRPFSFMTRRAARDWARIAETGRVVPITTRSVEQYRFIGLPGRPPGIVFAANGGHLIVDGEVDARWHRRVRRGLARRSAGLREIWDTQVSGLAAQPGVERVRVLDDLFIVARAEHGLRADFATGLAEDLAARGWRLSHQGQGVYLLPAGLDKIAACREAAKLLAARRTVAGGDSWLDAGMLARADLGIRPAHGELHEAGWAPDGIVVTESSGVRAGEQIAAWYAAQVFGAEDVHESPAQGRN